MWRFAFLFLLSSVAAPLHAQSVEKPTNTIDPADTAKYFDRVNTSGEPNDAGTGAAGLGAAGIGAIGAPSSPEKFMGVVPVFPGITDKGSEIFGPPAPGALQAGQYLPEIPGGPGHSPVQEQVMTDLQTNKVTEPGVQNLIDQAMKGAAIRRDGSRNQVGSKSLYQSTSHCYMHVKLALHAAKCTRSAQFGGASARQAVGDLASMEGMKRINVSSASEAPTGAILIFDGGEHGHIEIKTPDGAVSDYYHNGYSARPLLGVYMPTCPLPGAGG